MFGRPSMGRQTMQNYGIAAVNVCGCSTQTAVYAAVSWITLSHDREIHVRDRDRANKIGAHRVA